MVAFLGKKHEPQKNEEIVQEPTSRAGMKRKKDVTGEQKSKAIKAEGDVCTSRAANSKNVDHEDIKVSELESKLEAQAKELWALKDDLKKHVTTSEMREMLEANDQDSTGSELDLRDKW